MEDMLDEELLANMKQCDDDVMVEEDATDDRTQTRSEANISFHESADPLQDEEEPMAPTNFEYTFHDSDIEVSKGNLKEALTYPNNKHRRGRRRHTSYSSARGHKWSKEPMEVLKELDLPSHEACGKGPARSISNAVESWMLLFDDEILRLLMNQINEQIRKRKTRSPSHRLVDILEVRAWIGLSYLCGIFRNSEFNGPLEELWTLELGNAVFRATMTLYRFEFLNECLAKTKNLNDVWLKFIINCRSYYGASSWLTVDEVAPCLNLCCDAKTLYMTNSWLKVSDSEGLDHLICDFKTTGRNITLGKSYVDLQRCEELLKHSLSSLCVISLDSNPLDWPKNWSKSKEILYFDSTKLIPKDNENEALLVCGLDSYKLDPIRAYLKTNQACIQFYNLTQKYSTSKATHSGSTTQMLSLFHLFLDLAAVNSWILLRLSTKNSIPRIEQRDFHRQLGLFLTQQRLQRRLQRCSSENTSLVMRLQICEILGQSSRRQLGIEVQQMNQTKKIILDQNKIRLPEGITLGSRYGDKFRRCKPCSRNKRETKSRSRCQQCLSHRCGNHLISRCFECMGVPEGKLNETN